jgi:hypothetical protein
MSVVVRVEPNMCAGPDFREECKVQDVEEDRR